MIEASFRNQYRWYPDEKRISQAVHRAAEELKRNGARGDEMIGSPIAVAIPNVFTVKNGVHVTTRVTTL